MKVRFVVQCPNVDFTKFLSKIRVCKFSATQILREKSF